MSLDESGLIGEHDQLRSLPYVKFREDTTHVGFCDRDAHEQLLGDLGVGATLAIGAWLMVRRDV